MKEGEYYIINGAKNWVTNGINADYILLFVMTEKDIGHKGISCFIVDKKYEGFEIGKPEDKLGIKSSDTTELYFNNVKIIWIRYNIIISICCYKSIIIINIIPYFSIRSSLYIID